MDSLLKKLGLNVAGIVLASLWVVTAVSASVSSYTASGFSQFCSHNSSTCSKNENPGDRSGIVSCPSGNQTIDTVYVHAGNGETVFELPDTGYSTTFSNNNSTVTVAVVGTGSSHPDLSWIAVTCSVHTSTIPTPTTSTTITPSPTINPCANNACATPTLTPTPTNTPTPTQSPTPTVTEEPIVTERPTPTPSPSRSTSDGGNNSGGSNSNNRGGTSSPNTNGGNQPIQAVLGASTMAGTGTFETSLMNFMFLIGMMVLGAGFVFYAKEKKA